MRGYVALGSNLGDREGHLRAGLDGMARRGVRILALSSVWETEPVDGAGPNWFLNMTAGIECDLRPPQILERLLEVEVEVGRVRTAPNEPRVLDLDLLHLDGVRWSDERLRLPHPRMWSRRFVLAPLAEIAPDLRHPDGGRTVRQALEFLDGCEVRRIGSLPRYRLPPYNRQPSGQELADT